MIDSLTSLRFIFAMMVFGAHCYIIDDFFDAHFFKEGFVGVNFFFVLSGFIIAYTYQENLLNRKLDKRTFWVARMARVYPLHWLTLFIAIVVGDGIVTSGALDWCQRFLASFILVNAYVPRVDYFFSFNSPSWSLCCEQLFYVLFPFLLSLISKKGNYLFWLFCVMAVLMLLGMYITPEAQIKGYWYVNPVCRFPDFIIGMLLFQLYGKLKNRRITFVWGSIIEILSIVLFFCFYFYAVEVPKVYRYSCYYWLPVSMILLSFSLQKGIVSRVLSNRILIKGGEISYGFYLIHLLVLSFYVDWEKDTGIYIARYISIPILFCIIVLLSWVSHYYFEKPMNRWIKKIFNT